MAPQPIKRRPSLISIPGKIFELAFPSPTPKPVLVAKSTIPVPPLKGVENWRQWSFRMKAVLGDEGLLYFIQGESATRTISSNVLDDPETYEDGCGCRRSLRARAIALILCSIDDQVFACFESNEADKYEQCNMGCPYSIWNRLEGKFGRPREE